MKGQPGLPAVRVSNKQARKASPICWHQTEIIKTYFKLVLWPSCPQISKMVRHGRFVGVQLLNEQDDISNPLYPSRSRMNKIMCTSRFLPSSYRINKMIRESVFVNVLGSNKQ